MLNLLNLKPKKDFLKNNSSGQTLLMVLLIIVIGGFVLFLISQIISVRIRTSEIAKERIMATALSQESIEAVRLIAKADWHNIDTLDNTGTTPYYLYFNNGKWSLTQDDSYKSPSDFPDFERSIYFFSVSRDPNTDNIAYSYGEQGYDPDYEDPSTKKIKVLIRHKKNQKEFITYYYLTRWKNDVALQQDWSGGSGQESPIPVSSSTNKYSTGSKVETNESGYIILKPNQREIDYMEYSTDEQAQSAYQSSDSANLQVFSENTIKTQGSYSLKITATKNNSLNDTLTRTVSPTINLSEYQIIKIDARSSRTGSNFKITLRDDGGTTFSYDVNITNTDAWETKNWDISSVSNSDKDKINQIKIEITNADQDNTIYLDNIFATF